MKSITRRLLFVILRLSLIVVCPLAILYCGNGNSSSDKEGNLIDDSYVENDSIVLSKLIPVLNRMQYLPENGAWLFKKLSTKEISKTTNGDTVTLKVLKNIYKIHLVNGENRVILEEWVFNPAWYSPEGKDAIDFMYSATGEGDLLDDYEHLFNHDNSMINVLNPNAGKELNQETKLLRDKIQFYLDTGLEREVE
ncbi:MAG: hypothetical protein AAFV95_18975 [Bacteroidota bacterium]